MNAGRSELLLEVEEVTLAYGGVVAVREVSFELPEGRTLAVLGANGAGKTSLLRAISGLEPLVGGGVRVRGQDVTGWAPHRIARLGVAHVPADRGLFPTLSVADNLRMGRYGAGRDRDPDGEVALEEALERFPILRERADQTAGTMSGGQQQMLALARALVQRPALLLVDEMSMGLAPAIVEELFELVASLRDEGLTIVLVEQFVGQALQVADEVLVLEQGRVAVRGTPDELDDHDLAGVYLGAVGSAAPVEVAPPPVHATEPLQVVLGPRQVRALEEEARRRGSSVDAVLAELTGPLTRGGGS